MNSDKPVRCWFVDEPSQEPQLRLATIESGQLPAGEVEIEVAWSSINYKDGLAAQGHPGIVKSLPHVPGIDAAGTVLQSESSRFEAGQTVLVTGYDLGQGHWGGWSNRIRVPASWVIPLPNGLTVREAMILGTAGFTAAQCVLALERNGVTPSSGEIVVTGATGGVGSITLKILKKLGYRVAAVTGKRDQHSQLFHWGADRIIDRGEFQDPSEKPLLSARWAGGVDTVGGLTLTTLLRGCSYGGAVAACGLVGGHQLQMTLYPFLLRGIALCGVASADCPSEPRQRIWEKLAGAWKLDDLDAIAIEINMADVPLHTRRILAGQVVGRTLINVNA